jgi:hypothetical protein
VGKVLVGLRTEMDLELGHDQVGLGVIKVR